MRGCHSGANHSASILDPFSRDTLGSGLETWGHLYPREGTVNSNHDAKSASVTAWRAMDVLHQYVRDGVRVWVPLPANYPQRGRWVQEVIGDKQVVLTGPDAQLETIPGKGLRPKVEALESAIREASPTPTSATTIPASTPIPRPCGCPVR